MKGGMKQKSDNEGVTAYITQVPLEHLRLWGEGRFRESPGKVFTEEQSEMKVFLE